MSQAQFRLPGFVQKAAHIRWLLLPLLLAAAAVLGGSFPGASAHTPAPGPKVMATPPPPPYAPPPVTGTDYAIWTTDANQHTQTTFAAGDKFEICIYLPVNNTMWLYDYRPDGSSFVEPTLNGSSLTAGPYCHPFTFGTEVGWRTFELVWYDASGNVHSVSTQAYAGSSSTPGSSPGSAATPLAAAWVEQEFGGACQATWTRQGSSSTFAMNQSCSNGGVITATLAISVSGNQVSIARTNSSDGNNCTYQGTLSADGKSMSGTYTCPLIQPPPPGSWSATAGTSSTPSPSPSPAAALKDLGFLDFGSYCISLGKGYNGAYLDQNKGVWYCQIEGVQYDPITTDFNTICRLQTGQANAVAQEIQANELGTYHCFSGATGKSGGGASIRAEMKLPTSGMRITAST